MKPAAVGDSRTGQCLACCGSIGRVLSRRGLEPAPARPGMGKRWNSPPANVTARNPPPPRRAIVRARIRLPPRRAMFPPVTADTVVVMPAAGPHLSLSTTEPTAWGSGFASGLLSAVLGIAGLGAVLTLHFPGVLSATELRPFYELTYVRLLIHLTLIGSLALGTVSFYLRANKTLAVVGIGCTLAAALLGGSHVPVGGAVGAGSWLGVDFFVLNLVLYCAVFIPIERFFALRPEQQVFRGEWVVDLTYFFVNALLIEVLTLLTLRPAALLFS